MNTMFNKNHFLFFCKMPLDLRYISYLFSYMLHACLLFIYFGYCLKIKGLVLTYRLHKPCCLKLREKKMITFFYAACNFVF